MYFTNPLSSSPAGASSNSSPSPIFPTFLVPSIPFRRRKSSAESTGTVSSHKSTANEPSYLAHSASTLRCSNCLADLCPSSSIISKGFTGRHGRAYLVAPPSPSSSPAITSWIRRPRDAGNLPNTTLDKAVPRQLVTGAHTVADLRCGLCDAVLGWKYVAAEEAAQQYKVGKFILETKRVCKGVDWESGAHDDLNDLGGADGGGAGEVEFDSHDEDECEDLFAGVWTPALARKRRERKRALWMKEEGQDDMV